MAHLNNLDPYRWEASQEGYRQQKMGPAPAPVPLRPLRPGEASLSGEPAYEPYTGPPQTSVGPATRTSYVDMPARNAGEMQWEMSHENIYFGPLPSDKESFDRRFGPPWLKNFVAADWKGYSRELGRARGGMPYGKVPGFHGMNATPDTRRQYQPDPRFLQSPNPTTGPQSGGHYTQWPQ